MQMSERQAPAISRTPPAGRPFTPATANEAREKGLEVRRQNRRLLETIKELDENGELTGALLSLLQSPNEAAKYKALEFCEKVLEKDRDRRRADPLGIFAER